MRDKILIIDDDPGVIQLMERSLRDLGEIVFATNGKDAIRLANDSPPSIVLLDAEMPGMSGFKVFEALKSLPQMADVPIIFVTSHSESAFEVGILEMGAADFIAKPVNPAILQARVRAHLRGKQVADSLRLMATTDTLTGVANRRFFDESLHREWPRSRRRGRALAVLLIDVDHFKGYLDRYGQTAGDTCLQAMVHAFKMAVGRTADLIARCGGEEFAVLLPDTSLAGSECVAERIHSKVAECRILHDASPSLRQLTISVGIGYCDGEKFYLTKGRTTRRDPLHRRFSANDLLIAADRALYKAKQAGGGQTRRLSIADSETSAADGSNNNPGLLARSIERV